MDAIDMLGPAEKHIAEQLRTAVAAAKTEAQKLLDALDEIDTDRIEDAMLDSERKTTVITLLEPMQKMASNLGMSGLMPLVLKVVLTPKEERTV